MTEQELRQLVRDAIARHAGAPPSARTFPPDPRTLGPANALTSISHGLFVLPESGGPCLIEPTVACNHCGYCKSYGH